MTEYGELVKIVQVKVKQSKKPLSAMQKKFIEEHFVQGKALADAALAAGYGNGDRKMAQRQAYSVLQSKNVQEEVAKNFTLAHSKMICSGSMYNTPQQQKLLASDVMKGANEVSFEYKMGKLQQIIDSFPVTKVTIDELEKNSSAYKVVLSALDLMNKMQGHYAPTKSLNVDLSLDARTKDFIEMSDKILIEHNKLNGERL